MHLSLLRAVDLHHGLGHDRAQILRQDLGKDAGSKSAEKSRATETHGLSGSSAAFVRVDNGHNTEAMRHAASVRQRAFCAELGIHYDRSIGDEAFYALNGSLREMDPSHLPAEYQTLRVEEVYDLSFTSWVPLTVRADDLGRLQAYRADRRDRITDLVENGPLEQKDLAKFEAAVAKSEASMSQKDNGDITFLPLYGEVSYVMHLWEGHKPVSDYYFGRDRSKSMTLPGSIISVSPKYAAYVKQINPGQKFFQRGNVCIAPLQRKEEEFLKVAIEFDFIAATVGNRLAQRSDLDAQGNLTEAARQAGKMVFYSPPLSVLSTKGPNATLRGDQCFLIEKAPVCSIQELISLYNLPLISGTPLTSFMLAMDGDMKMTEALHPDARCMMALSTDGGETGYRLGTTMRRGAQEPLDACLRLALAGRAIVMHPITGDDGASVPDAFDLGRAMDTKLTAARFENQRAQQARLGYCTTGAKSLSQVVARLGDHAGWMSIGDEYAPKGRSDASDDVFTEELSAAFKAIIKMPLQTPAQCAQADGFFKRLQKIANEANRLTDLGTQKLDAQRDGKKSGISTDKIGKAWLDNMQALDKLTTDINKEHSQSTSFDPTTSMQPTRASTSVFGALRGRSAPKPAGVQTLGTFFQIAKGAVVTLRFDDSEDIHVDDLAQQLSNWRSARGGFYPSLNEKPPAYTA